MMDPLEWVRRLTHHIPDARAHLVLHYAAYANRCRARCRDTEGESVAPADGLEAPKPRKSRASWVRLLKRVFGAEMTCPRCGVDLVMVSVNTEPRWTRRGFPSVCGGGRRGFAPPPAPVPVPWIAVWGRIQAAVSRPPTGEGEEKQGIHVLRWARKL